MKTIALILLAFMSLVVVSQNPADTVMLNKSFMSYETQTYKISTLRKASNYQIVSVSAMTASAGFFIVSNICYRKANDAETSPAPDLNYIEDCQYTGDVMSILGYLSAGLSVSFQIASLIQLRQPTTIKPVSAL